MNRIAFFLLLLIAISQIATAQTGQVFIGKKRPQVQTELRTLKIEEYEKNHIGLKQGEDVWLYVFFNNSNVCIRHYWLVYADKKEEILSDFDSLGWQKKSDVQLVKDNYTCNIQSINEGKNLIFLVEQSKEPLVDNVNENKTKEKVQISSTSHASPETRPTTSKVKKKVKKEPEFQGLRILGWEVIKLDKSED